MQPGGQDAFASAALTLNQDGALRVGDFPCLLGQLPHGRAGADERINVDAGLPGFTRELLLAVSPAFEQPLEDHQEGREVYRLGEKILRAFFDRPDGHVDGAVARQDDHWDLRIDRLQFGEKVEGISVWKELVHDGHIRAGGSKDLFGRTAIASLFNFEPFGLRESSEAEADRFFVIYD